MEVANIYDNGPISPIARINDNLSIWSENDFLHFNITYLEPVPRGSPMTVDMVAAWGATVIAAYGSIPQQVVAFLQMNANELLHLRWEPLDDVEGLLWQLPSQPRFNPRGAHARVSQFTEAMDPFLATTTFWILGGTPAKDMALEVRNPNPVALPMARFAFFGFRYILVPLKVKPENTTYLPAQGR